jgi:hypothetical protein
MKPLRIVALLLILAGILGIVYEKVTYTTETHEAKLGPIEFEVKEKETVDIPKWAGIAAIVVGAGLLVVPMKH